EPKPEPIPEPKPEPIPEPKPEPIPEPKPEPIPEPKPEPIPEPKPEPIPEPKPEPAPESKPEPKQETPEHRSLVELLRQGDKPETPTVLTIGDRLGEQKELPLQQRINSHPVADLRQIININDKFSFMSELFHNNMKAYNKFILDLNGIATRSEAMQYVETVAAENKWDMESLAVKTFYTILERKF
ncbi:MAG: hypothetical protein IJU81_08260, partial [Bacteroidales bacterium]|nr:hypothetical protein [Bacteroidales bacterium]